MTASEITSSERYTLSSGVLAIADPKEQDVGSYHCRARNQVGSVMSDSAKVIQGCKCNSYCASHIQVQPHFRRYYFYILSDPAQTQLDHFNVLDELWCLPNFIQIRQQVKNFPIDSHCYNVAESGQFLQWGSMGKFFICCRIKLTVRPKVRLKR